MRAVQMKVNPMSLKKRIRGRFQTCESNGDSIILILLLIRGLRTAAGVRGVGKFWENDESNLSSDQESIAQKKSRIKKLKVSNAFFFFLKTVRQIFFKTSGKG